MFLTTGTLRGGRRPLEPLGITPPRESRGCRNLHGPLSRRSGQFWQFWHFWQFALLTLLLSASVLSAQQAPSLTGAVNDFAGVVDAASAQELDRRIRALQQATGDVVVVATVKSFEPFADINELALRMFENGGRGIGEKGKDNGALIVAAVQERQVRIEVGYDLEGIIPDGYAGETIRQAIVPEFRRGAYGAGLLAGSTRLINRIAESRGVQLQDVPAGRQPVTAPPEVSIWPLFVIAWILLVILSNRRRGRRRRRWGRGPWSGWNSGVGPFGTGMGGFGGGFGGFGGGGRGGFGGGGFGGFGGGRSGGGGASGGW